MINARIGRLGMLAVGLGIGAAVASTPGTATADVFPPFDPNDFAISIDGVNVFQAGNAIATSSAGAIAIAIGNGAQADSSIGFGNLAFADGTDSIAQIYDVDASDLDTAITFGDHSFATSGGGLLDFAFADGYQAGAGAANGVIIEGPPSAFNLGVALGPNTNAAAGAGNDNVAYAVNPTDTDTSPATIVQAFLGNGNIGLGFGAGDDVHAGGVGFDSEPSVLGNFDLAALFGMDSSADAGSTLTAPGDFDLSAVFGDMLHSTAATGGNFLADILPLL
jgi:hypothetical protein